MPSRRPAPRSRRPLARRGAAATVAPPRIDPARKRHYETLLATMQTSRRTEASGFDAYWESVGAILASNLWAAGQYSDARTWIRDVIKLPERTVRRMVRVARYASPVEETLYGETLLDAALAYIDATTAHTDGPLPIRFDKLRISVTRAGKPLRVLLSDTTVPEVQAATRAVLKGKGKGVPPSPIEQAFLDAIAKDKTLKGIVPRVRDGYLVLGRIELTRLDALLTALRGAKWREKRV